MLGAFAKTTGFVSLDSLSKGMESVAFRDADVDKNMQAMQRGFEETKVYDLNRKERL